MIINNTNNIIDPTTTNPNQLNGHYRGNHRITLISSNKLPCLEEDTQALEHAIQMSSQFSQIEQMASHQMNSNHARSEEDIFKYNTPFHTNNMQIELSIISPTSNTLSAKPKVTPKENSIKNHNSCLQNAKNLVHFEKKTQINPNPETS